MSVYLGVDFHARTQTVCWCDTSDGLIERRILDHQKDDVRDFYAQFAVPAVVGLEATGYARWFHRLVESLGHRLLIGDAYAIRKCALRRQKMTGVTPSCCSICSFMGIFQPYTFHRLPVRKCCD